MQTMKMINLKDLIPSKTNPRKTFDKKQMDELTVSIKEKGVLQPILVRPFDGGELAQGAYEVVAGERRYRAALSAAIAQIPAVIKDLSDLEALEIQFIENLHRADVHPLEEAEAYEALLKHKDNAGIEDLSAKVGKSTSYIYGRMKLCALIPAARKKFIEGEISASMALLLARVPQSLQKQALDDILDEYDPKSYREAKEYIEEEFMIRLDQAPFDTKDATLCPKAGACTQCPKRTGNSPDLFPDIKKSDVCTDTVCFKIKKEAHFKIKIEQAKDSGQTVLKTKEVYDDMYGTSPLRGFINITDTCYDDPKRRTYGQLLAKTDKKPALVVNPKGDICEVIQRSTAIAAFKESGVKMDNDSGRDPKKLAQAKKDNRVVETRRAFWISKIEQSGNQRCANAVALAEILYHLGSNYAEEIVKGKIKDADDYGKAWDIIELYKLGDSEIQKLLIKALKKKADILADEDLDFLCAELGFSMAKDYVITEAYLNAMTKDDLGKLIKELKITDPLKDMTKKSDLVRYILDHSPKGKVPAELLTSKKGKGI